MSRIKHVIVFVPSNTGAAKEKKSHEEKKREGAAANSAGVLEAYRCFGHAPARVLVQKETINQDVNAAASLA